MIPGRSGRSRSAAASIELDSATNKPDEIKKWRAERTKYPETKPEGQK